MRARIARRPAESSHEEAAGCFLVCSEHGRQAFKFAHHAAAAACRTHNLELHA